MFDRILEEESVSAPWYIWAALIFTATVSFWQQATVTEDRFVPALNVVATTYNIPKDVAGATLMAAGASSPEFFSSMVALFVTHTSLGLGTVVGSEIFNQLCICAGSIFAAKDKFLKLDKPIAIREMGFYALAIVLLLFALDDRRPLVDANGDDIPGPNHIYISFGKALSLFGAYLLYVVVLANFDSIMACISKKKKPAREKGVSYSAIGNLKASFMTTVKHEPEGFEATHHVDTHEVGLQAGLFQSEHTVSSIRGIMNDMSTLSKRVLTLGKYAIHADKPSDHHGLEDVEVNEFDEKLGCFLWQKSNFYDKARTPKNAWHLRWFTFNHDTLTSEPDRFDHAEQVMRYRKFDSIIVDTEHLIFKIGHSDGKGREYTLMAPSREILDKTVAKCESIMDAWEKQDAGEEEKADTPEEDDIEHEEVHGPITEFPVGGSAFAIVAHYVLFPLKFLLQVTVPDVRHEGSTIATAWMAVASCLGWLIIGSYVMVRSLETLAGLMEIPDIIVGVTASAVGTSLPNYVASQVAANQGFGNMAISNAFGSNTFNLMIALGLPWTLYIGLINHGEPYSGLTDDGISVSVYIMASILGFHFILMLFSKFEMYLWHAYLFIAIYASYIAYVVATVYM